MDLAQILGAGYAPSYAVQTPAPESERAAYLDQNGVSTGSIAGDDAYGKGRGDPAMTAGAMALLAIAGLCVLRYVFRGAIA